VIAGYAAVGLVVLLAIFLGYDDPEFRAEMLENRMPIRPEYVHAFAVALQANDVGGLARILFLHHGLLLGVLVFPVLEELLFKGLVLREAVKTLSPFYASGVASALFAVSHQVFTVPAGEGIGYGLFLFFSGLLSCYFALRSRSLLPGIVTHMIHNGTLASIGVMGHYFT
jgi:membrane protease YdiL (CAAX protease family)